MTKPTQAQIEAAHQIRVWLGRNATAETNPEKKAAFIEAHNVALKIEEAALTAAAEAGEPCGCGYDNPDDVCMVHEPIIKRHVAATIERCAQVCDDGTECGEFYAIKIRALKGYLSHP